MTRGSLMRLCFDQRHYKGFSLAEILVAITILSLLAAGFFAITFSARNLIWRSKKRVVALEVAKANLESLRQYINASTWYNAGSPLEPTSTWVDMGAVAGFPGYNWSYRVDSLPGGYTCRGVTVRVRWNESSF